MTYLATISIGFWCCFCMREDVSDVHGKWFVQNLQQMGKVSSDFFLSKAFSRDEDI